jgi:YVTN family beta-propeller protein
VAVAPDGSRVYSTVRVRIVERVYGPTEGELLTYGYETWKVVESYYAVSIIDTSSASSPTYNKEVGLIRLRGGAADMDVSPDGKRLYVDQGDGKTVTVVDTTTNEVIGAFITDQSANPGVRTIEVSADGGTVFITDSSDNKLYVVALGNPTMM